MVKLQNTNHKIQINNKRRKRRKKELLLKQEMIQKNFFLYIGLREKELLV